MASPQGTTKAGGSGPQEKIEVSKISGLTLYNTPENFTAGKVGLFLKEWQKLTSDKFILDIINHGYKIEFSTLPCNQCNRSEITFSGKEAMIIDSLIEQLLCRQVIERVERMPDQVLSNIFIRAKQDGSYRLILNLKHLNEHVEKKHFKMETLKSALHLVKKDCFFAKLDLKDAYYSIPVHKDYRRYLCFIWKGQIFRYACLPNGLSSAPRIFTKVMKPVFSSLRKEGQTNSAYIDDVLLQNDTYEKCRDSVVKTATLVDNLGLTAHQKKSVFVPTQTIEFVGFLINSITMTVKLTAGKTEDLVQKCSHLISRSRITIREFAQIIGKMIASEPGVPFAPLYYKLLEIQKDAELKRTRGQFDQIMIISNECKVCLQWWVDNLKDQSRPIVRPKPNRKIESDSSLIGYGAYDSTSGNEYSGIWDKNDKVQHINYLELKAAFLALKRFATENEHVKLMLDNTTAIAYLTKMGGRKTLLNSLTKEIWEWCISKNIWISAYHIPGKLNERADALSRQKLSIDMEWSLDSEIFQKIMEIYGRFDIDLFASKWNYKLGKYVSFKPDPNAFSIDAFSLTWSNLFPYIFPPFSVIGSVLQKIEQDQSEGVLIAPIFSTQPWFPKLLHMIVEPSYILPAVDKILSHPTEKHQHRLTKMVLGVFRISGKPYKPREYQAKLPTLSSPRGDQVHKNNMGRICKSGSCFVVNERLIHLNHL